MDWKRAMEEERAALGRVVALLCALALLAERASGRSSLVRSLVLWFLRHAEATARDFVAGGANSPGAPSALWPVVPAGAGPLDAMRLASGLRALARRLDRQARRLSRLCRRTGRDAAAQVAALGDAWRAGRMPAALTALVTLAGLAAAAPGALDPVRAPDTS